MTYLRWVEYERTNMAATVSFEVIRRLGCRNARDDNVPFPLEVGDERDAKRCVATENNCITH